MRGGSQSPVGARPGRGRPAGRGGFRRRGAPTQARLLALRVLLRVERTRAYADLALHAALAQSPLVGPDRALATELVYGTLRWRGRLDYLLSKVLDRELDKLEPVVVAGLRLGAYQIVFSERIPSSAAVDESVRCVHALGAERAGGLVNAVLRRFAGEFQQIPLPDLPTDPVGHLTHALSQPAWLAQRWIDVYGPEEAAALARALNEVPPRTERANRLRTTRDALHAELVTRFPNATACRLAPDGIVLGRRGDPGRDPAFQSGRMTVQDESSQLVVELLDPSPRTAFSTPARRRARRRRGLRSASGRVAASWPSTATPGALAFCAGTPGALALRTCRPVCATPQRPLAILWRSDPSTACWSMPRARASAPCAAIPTRAGASLPPTSRSSPTCRERSSHRRRAA